MKLSLEKKLCTAISKAFKVGDKVVCQSNHCGIKFREDEIDLPHIRVGRPQFGFLIGKVFEVVATRPQSHKWSTIRLKDEDGNFAESIVPESFRKL